MAKFLIIVPTLNSYQLLPKLITSLESQIYQNWKLIFVDGKSNYDHKEYLKSICKKNCNFRIIEQSNKSRGIYGAMNDGLLLAEKDEWVLFLGSDDWIDNKKTLFDLNMLIQNCSEIPDLIIAEARYYDSNLKMRRVSKFKYIKNLNFSLFVGFTPPHQGTLFGPGSLQKLKFFDENISLSADLDYYLKLRKYDDLNIKTFDKNIVKLRVGGVSGRENKRRFAQVIRCYKKEYSFLWIIPFIMRYILRFFSLL